MRDRYFRVRDWLRRGPVLTHRQFFASTATIYIFVTILVGSIMFLIRENQERARENRAAFVKSCREANQVRSELRNIIQDIKNITYTDPSIEAVLQRYVRLTQIQAVLADKRCIPKGSQP